MKKICKIVWIVFAASILFFSEDGIASPQLPDYVIYKGDTIPVYDLILEQYFEKINKSDEGSLFGLKFRNGASLNCWRGYQAIYLIKNDSLFLTDIIECGERSGGRPVDRHASMKRAKDLFKDNAVNGKVFLDWYTGEFSLPKAGLLRWDQVLFKTFEQETLVQVEHGKVRRLLEIENYIDHPKRIDRRYGDTISNVFFRRLQKLKWKSIGEFDCSEKYLITIGKNGKVNKVSMADYETREEISQLWERAEYNYCISTIRKGLRRLKFDILKMKNKPIEEDVYLEIWFEEDGKLVNWTN